MTISTNKAKVTNLKIEDSSDKEINNWFLDQSPRTRANTISSQILYEAYISKNCNQKFSKGNISKKNYRY